MSDLDAEDAGIPNERAVFLDPQFVHVEFIDIPDFVANLLTQAVDTAVDGALGFLPGWARDLIKSILGGAINILRTLRPGDTTHCVNTDQRYVGREIGDREPDRIRVRIPEQAGGVPPSYYMLFIERRGTPSVATFIQVS